MVADWLSSSVRNKFYWLCNCYFALSDRCSQDCNQGNSQDFLFMYTGLTACGYNWHMDADSYSDKLWHTLLNCHRVSEAHCTMQPHVNAAGLISHNQSDPLLPVQIDIINTIQ